MNTYRHFIEYHPISKVLIDAYSSAFQKQSIRGVKLELEKETILHSEEFPFGGRQFSPLLFSDGIPLYQIDKGKIILRDSSADQFEKAKSRKIDMIDRHTEALCESGIVTPYGKFNTRKIDQQNWLALVVLADSLFQNGGTVPVSTSEGGRYVIPDKATLMNIYALSMQKITGIREAGRTLRIRALESTSPAELNAVVDSRS